MADTPPASGLTLQEAIDFVRAAWAALVAPATIGGVGMYFGIWRWRGAMRDRAATREAARRGAEEAAEAAERARQDRVDADQIARLEAEIRRKDLRIDRLECRVGVLGEALHQATDYIGGLRHELRNVDMVVKAVCQQANLSEPDKRVLPAVPDFEAAATRLLLPPP